MKFSLDSVKKNLKWLVCAFLGIFHFVLLAFPYMSAYASFGKQRESADASGYTTLSGDFAEADAGFLVVLFQVLTLICAIVLLLFALYILVAKFFGKEIKKSLNIELPASFGPVKVSALANLTFFAYGVLNALVLLSIVIVSLANSQSAFGVQVGISPAFGAFFAPILAFGAFFGVRFVEANVPGFSKTGGKKYTCEKCGEPAKAGVSFCGKCGGRIVEVVPRPTVTASWSCEVCKAPAAPGTAFCPVCGGKVIASAPQAAPAPAAAPTSWVCEQCGQSTVAGAKFCGKCGGKIIQK